MPATVCLFTADLRLHDNPVLTAAVRAAGQDGVVPLFVLDTSVHQAGFDAPNRLAFLADCLADLDGQLRARGGRLVLRKGGTVPEVLAVCEAAGALEVHLAAGSSGFAQLRERRLAAALAESGRTLHVHEAVTTAVAPGEVLPQGKDHYSVFTPYFRRWSTVPLRKPLPAPRSVPVPDGVRGVELPYRRAELRTSPGLAPGGEQLARRMMSSWVRGPGLESYAERGGDLHGENTSRLSPHLHFGTVSAAELVQRVRQLTARDEAAACERGEDGRGVGGRGVGGPAGGGRKSAYDTESPEAFVRQLAWRDFNHQLLAVRPDAARHDYRPRGDRWRRDERALRAWKEGRTGYPVVDAAMRQLAYEGWLPGRARLLVASFLCKTLYLDWRAGAAHFLDLLVDGDIANNQLNWQWAAGTGTDTRPGRVLNPLAQSRRFDADGEYVRRWVPELAGLTRPQIHEPWRLDEAQRRTIDYPQPLVDLAEGADRFHRARDSG